MLWCCPKKKKNLDLKNSMKRWVIHHMHSTQVFCQRFYELSVHASYLSCEVLPWTVPKRVQICPLSWGHSKPKSQICSIWLGFPGGAKSKEPTCQWRRHRFNPWVRKIPWRGAWQPTPIFLPGESHGQWSLAGYSPWGCKESHTTAVL